MAELPQAVGSEINGIRPVVILQNNIGTFYGRTLIAAALTTQIKKKTMPTHVIIESGSCAGSMALAEQIHTISKDRMIRYPGTLDSAVMDQISQAVRVSLGLASRG